MGLQRPQLLAIGCVQEDDRHVISGISGQNLAVRRKRAPDRKARKAETIQPPAAGDFIDTSILDKLRKEGY